jgi:hypothetical protein
VVRVRHRSYFSGKPGRTQGRMDPSTVLDLSLYPWDLVALQSRRSIVLRLGPQRSSPCAYEQRAQRSRSFGGPGRATDSKVGDEYAAI